MDLKNKWVFVTGASRGVGREMARSMARLGANIILQSRDVSHTKPLEAELQKSGAQTLSFACDLECEKSVREMLNAIDEAKVQVDFIFNNAGIQVPYCEDYFTPKREDYLKAYAVNCLAPVQIAYHFLPKMIRNGFGRIVMTTSGIADQPELMGYACSKAGLNAFVKDFAVKLNGTNVMMNLLDPGWLQTDLGGPNAPNTVETVIPGALVGALLEDKKSGRWFSAQEFAGLSLEAALEKAAK